MAARPAPPYTRRSAHDGDARAEGPLVRTLAISALIVGGVAQAAPAPAPSPFPDDDPRSERAHQAVLGALASGADANGQAEALARLAWPAALPRDEAVSIRARDELRKFGEYGAHALHEAINTVRTEYTGEVVKTLLSAETLVTYGTAPDFVAAYLDALWVGNREAKELVIPRLATERNALAVQSMIDSAIDDPDLDRPVIRALGAMKFEQARFWLEKMMLAGPVDLRPAAASSLAQIGGSAVEPLRKALSSPDRPTRVLAVRALLPAATDLDLSAIYAYLEAHADDDASLTASLKAMAATIERAIAARDAAESAAAPKDF